MSTRIPWHVRFPRTRVRIPGGSRDGLSVMGALSLVSVVLVLVFVSLPRLRHFARHENEADARATARLLASELDALLEEQGDTPRVPSVEELVGSDAVARALSDGEFLAAGGLLRRHGYLFGVVRIDGAGPAPAEHSLLAPRTVRAAEPHAYGVLAWPWQHGLTGSGAWLAAGAELYWHDNAERVWNGPEQPPAPPLTRWDGWRASP